MNTKLLQTGMHCGLILVVLGLCAVPITTDASAFSDANWISLNPTIPGADGIVRTVILDQAGGLYICGDFSAVGDVVAQGVAKWNGTKWTGLASEFGVPSQFAIGARVHALAVWETDLYVAGEFTTVGGIAATNIAKWNGSSWSAVGSGLGNEYDGVYALAVLGTDLYAGGRFTNAGGIAANSIAKWNGSGWSPVGLGVNDGYSGGLPIVSALAVSGSDLYVGGSFRTAGTLAANGIAKWDGNGWSTFGSGVRANVGGDPYVGAIAISGSDLYVGGWFTTAGGTRATNVAKWNGSNWSPLGFGMNNNVRALAVSGNNLYVGGYFSTVAGVVTNAIAKWDGNNWSALGTGVTDSVFALAVFGSDLYVGGHFMTAGDSIANSIAKWDGSSWLPLAASSGINGVVSALALSGNDLYAGGAFSSVRNTLGGNVAQWNGTEWSVVGEMHGQDDGRPAVSALAILDGDLCVGGLFTNAGGIIANNISKWDGKSWSALGSGIGGRVSALAVFGDDLYAGGLFTTAGDQPATNIAKWNGSYWSAVGSGLTPSGQFPMFPLTVGLTVRALATSGEVLYAGGTARRSGWVAKWDGTNWSSLKFAGDNVLALATSGTDIYVGTSTFITDGSVFKWDGTNWSALGGILPSACSLAVYGDDLYVGGAPDEGGSAGTYLAKWNGNNWSTPGSGVGKYYDGVYAMALSGSDLYVGGSFATAGGRVSGQVARAYLPTLPALSVLRSGSDIRISWPSAGTADFALVEANALTSAESWVVNSATVSDDGAKKSVTLPATNSARFLGLRRR